MEFGITSYHELVANRMVHGRHPGQLFDFFPDLEVRQWVLRLWQQYRFALSVTF